MFSLCIPTMDRYDTFLAETLPRYLEMDLIDEIVISDENGHDVAKISAAFPDHPKLRLYVNPQRLGPLLNKLQVCSLAKREWIALMDSDNFAGADYFAAAKAFLDSNMLDAYDKKTAILAPIKCRPRFDFSYLSGLVYRRGDFQKNHMVEMRYPKEAAQSPGITLMNTGNFIVNRYLAENVDLTRENPANFHSPYDVIYLNTMWFEQLDAHLHIVYGMEYDHALHDDSLFLRTYQQYQAFSNEIHRRYFSLL